MSSSVIGALRVNLGLDSAQFEKGSKRAQSSLATMKKQFMAVAAVASALGVALSGLAMRGAADIDKAAKAARRLGASVGGYRALELAAGEAGVSLSTLTDAVQTMDREVARGSKNAVGALGKLGLAVADLDGLDADQKLALISDRVAEMGLSTGEASALLQDLGIRNREMLLAVLAGGDAFRSARADIEDYGLALSQVDSEKIELANDRIGRLALVGQYLAQEVALKIVPAFGALAKAMTDSLREGGALRAMIDGLVDNLGRMATYLAVAVTGFGVRFVGALVAAQIATLSLSGALAFLRGALIRTGVGALIVGLGELVYQFSRLVVAAGGFGNALELLKDVALGVWDKIKAGGEVLLYGLQIVFNDIEYAWILMVGRLATSWGEFLDSIANTQIGGMLGFEGGNAESALAGQAALMGANTDALARTMGKLADAKERLGAPISGLEELRAAMAAAGNETNTAADAADRFNAALGETGGAAGGAAAGLQQIEPAVDSLKSQMDALKSSFASAFEGLLTGAKTAKEAISDLLASLAKLLINKAFESLWAGIGGAFKIPGFATGTSYAPGGMALVGERGPELVNLPRGSQVLNANQTRNAMAGGKQQVEIILRAPAGFTAEQIGQVQGISLKVTETRIAANNRAQGDARYLMGG